MNMDRYCNELQKLDLYFALYCIVCKGSIKQQKIYILNSHRLIQNSSLFNLITAGYLSKCILLSYFTTLPKSSDESSSI